MSRDVAEIKKDIVEHLLWDSRIEGSDIQVDVGDDLSVTLSGTASSPLVKQAAAEDTFAIPGIAKVANTIEVREPVHGVRRKGAELQSALESVFALHRGLDKVKAGVEDGVVSLSGSVENLWLKMRAEELASEMAGSEKINNELTVVPNSTPRDETIASGILSAMERTEKVDPRKITVEVRGGKVTLSGTLGSWEKLSAAYSAAKYARGVISIDNQLRVMGKS
jgi:hyperosmotically inducible protein